MKTTNRQGRKTVGVKGIGPGVPKGRPAEAGQRQSHDKLERRVAELERQNAGLSAKNAGLMEAYKKLTDAGRQLQALLDNVPDRIYFKDTQSRFLNLNKALGTRLGVANPEQAVGKTDSDFFPPEQAGVFFEDEQRVMKTGKALINKTEQRILLNNEIVWTSTTKVPLRDEKGKVVGIVGINRDITVQKKAEESLRRSHNELEQRVAERTAQLAQERLLLRTLIDNLPDGVYAKDTAGRKTLANPADLTTLRCKTEAEAIGKSDFDLFPKDIAEKFWADDQKVLAGQPVINREEYLFDEAGEKRWLLTSKLPLRGQQGTVVGLIGIGRDITKLKEAENALGYEQELFQTLLGSIPDRIYFKDRESRIVRASKSKVEATLQTVRESRSAARRNSGPDQWPAHLASVEAFGKWLIGKTDFDTYPETHARAAHEDEQRIMRTGQPVVGKVERVTLSDGNVIWRRSTKMPWHDKNGRVIGTFGISSDLTGIREAEEALVRERLLLRTLIDNLPDSVYAKDTAGRKILANPADLKNLRCKTEAEAIGKSDFDLFPKDLAEKFWADDLKVIAGQPVINREEYLFDEEGGKRWLLTSKLPLRALDGTIVGLIGIGRDITQQKQAEEALLASEEKLRQSAVQLERSNHELQDFAYVASHDLQEPLRKITVFSERLKEKNTGKFDSDSSDYLERMQKATGRMQTLINDLLSFSRVTSKAQPFVPVNLAEVASGVLEDLEGRIEMVKGRVELGALPVIDAEPLQMRQLLQNLIGNALKFRRPEEPPVVKVAAEIISDPAAPEKKLCRLTVSDNCIGFDEKYVDRIFNVFQRLHTRNEYEGTGMGLAIVKKIAVYHGGDITAKSKPGEGSTFILTVPAAHSQKPQAETANQENPP